MAVTYGIDRSGSAGSGGSALAYPFDSLTDPNADRIVFWDDSAGDFNWLVPGSGLTLTNVTLAVNIDDTPANGVTNNAISSNWAYDHENAADPHTGYRLESADHTHQSTGAQGGQLDHGAALTGLTDDDHTQYLLLIGRTSGQVVKGGVDASATLTLRGTSNATKGLLLLNDEGGDIQIGGGTSASLLRFMEPSGSGTNYTAFKAQAQAGSVTYILPAADATVSGYALKSDGAGNLSWGAAGGGGASASVNMAGHGFSVGNVLYHNGSTYALADADSVATAEVVGIVASVEDVDNFTLALGGPVTGLSGLTAGTLYFLSGTAGALTATEPSTVGQVSKPLLIAYSTTAGYFFNMRGSVVGTASSTLSVENFSGDGSDTTFTLASSPLENNTFVMVEGVYQQKNTYSISGTTLTFTTAPPSGTNNIEVVTVGSVNIGTATALSGDALDYRFNCRFEYTSTSVCTLNRFKGKYLFINGVNETIPSTAPTLANSALGANDTTYYVYAYMSSGTMTLEASATAYATDSTYGHKIKSGDATRTLVGMVRKTGGNFSNSTNIKFVRSYYNDMGIVNAVASQSVTGVTSTSLADRGNAGYFLVWSGEVNAFSLSGLVSNSTAGAYCQWYISMDGTLQGGAVIGTSSAAGDYLPLIAAVSINSIAEGYHYYSLHSKVSAGTGAFESYALCATFNGSGA